MSRFEQRITQFCKRLWTGQVIALTKVTSHLDEQPVCRLVLDSFRDNVLVEGMRQINR